ncbi:bifunctional glutamate N-acetyltransferase/amino-acid acetyltransferase ArgJ [aff. Roholtiella sp. LEGE 12411]|uniref:bifunctional glutamate N-acetyltransferase/amino-acid acetyltransferase ArgJ n=1 Tax=aff. Roholtiella sp. LEGE 12411 TaxID=1828822 RepID=UPI00187FEE52|nr:bifunctional glutamate N-acetyltransferase/amino-acid acetyltransferase ArgJ [aff. Roholtiella sp. LEGE 12411]MBE9033902.1 bifunctional glutamate N-acetyltransferase/amino-acid acetyltransferase ArgJ [aff. Roholtiella sp. LEGE 12411]
MYITNQVHGLKSLRIHAPLNGDPEQTTYKFWSQADQKWCDLCWSLRYQPSGIQSVALSAGVKKSGVLDFTVVKLPRRGSTVGVFTQNRCSSPAVKIDRSNLANGYAQALVVVSKNANVFTPTDEQDALQIINSVSNEFKIDADDVLISCTGVIGVPLPMDRLLPAIEGLSKRVNQGLTNEVAEAILTTDFGIKVCSAKAGDVFLAGVAKGAGMIEPNMATMLVYFFTNVNADPAQLSMILKRVVARTFNSISVDTDTSTSDSVILFSTSELEATEERLQDLESALAAASLKLCQDILYQAEGSTKLVEVTVSGGSSEQHAKQVAKLIVNSPLVKTAIFGSDPNWGRIVMALGKPGQDSTTPIDPSNICISIAGTRLFENGKAINLNLDKLSSTLQRSKKVAIHVELGEGSEIWTVWGCDLGYDYIKINAEYTT